MIGAQEWPPEWPSIDALLRIAIAVAGDRREAEHLVDDAVWKALRSPPRHDSNLKGWFGRVITNLWIDRTRERGRDVTAIVDPRALDLRLLPASDPADATARREALVALLEVIETLDDSERAIIDGMYFGDLTPRELSDQLGLSYRAVHRLHRSALDHIRRSMTRGDEPERGPLAILVTAVDWRSMRAAVGAGGRGLTMLSPLTLWITVACIALLAVTAALLRDPRIGAGARGIAPPSSIAAGGSTDRSPAVAVAATPDSRRAVAGGVGEVAPPAALNGDDELASGGVADERAVATTEVAASWTFEVTLTVDGAPATAWTASDPQVDLARWATRIEEAPRALGVTGPDEGGVSEFVLPLPRDRWMFRLRDAEGSTALWLMEESEEDLQRSVALGLGSAVVHYDGSGFELDRQRHVLVTSLPEGGWVLALGDAPEEVAGGRAMRFPEVGAGATSLRRIGRDLNPDAWDTIGPRWTTHRGEERVIELVR